jgi:hypothetical protein
MGDGNHVKGDRCSTTLIHPRYPTTVVRGRSTFEWLEGKRFLIQRSVADHPAFPDAMAVFGVTSRNGSPARSAAC